MKVRLKILLVLLLTSCLSQKTLNPTPKYKKQSPVKTIGIGDIALVSKTYIEKMDSTPRKKTRRIIWEDLRVIRVPVAEKYQDSLFREMFDTIILNKQKRLIRKDTISRQQ